MNAPWYPQNANRISSYSVLLNNSMIRHIEISTAFQWERQHYTQSNRTGLISRAYQYSLLSPCGVLIFTREQPLAIPSAATAMLPITRFTCWKMMRMVLPKQERTEVPALPAKEIKYRLNNSFWRNN